MAAIVLSETLEWRMDPNASYDGPQWGEFQSLAQLAVATNGAFSAITAFLGTDISKERVAISRLSKIIKDHKNNQELLNSTRGIPADIFFRSLNAECDFIERISDFAMNIVVRPLCVIGLIAGITLLVVSSFKYKKEIDNLSIAMMITSNLPFIIGTLFVIYISFRTHIRVGRVREKIERVLQ